MIECFTGPQHSAATPEDPFSVMKLFVDYMLGHWINIPAKIYYCRYIYPSFELIQWIRTLNGDVEKRMREALPKIYSYELLSNLFRHPYTSIEERRKSIT